MTSNYYCELNSLSLSQVESMSDVDLLSHEEQAYIEQNLQDGSGSQGYQLLQGTLSWNSQPHSQDMQQLNLSSLPPMIPIQDHDLFGSGAAYQIPGVSDSPFGGDIKIKGVPTGQGLSLSQSSTASIDDGIPSIETWEGPYGFGFSLEPGTTRKFNFSTRGNKLFCLPSHEIEFFFTYNFENCKHKDMKVVGFLRYTKSDAAAVPVLRCMNHEMEDKSKLQENTANSLSVANETVHVLKCLSPKSTYFQDKNKRCNVTVPMGRPYAGSSTISKLFKFDCLSSCKRANLPKKCPITCVFELHEMNKVVGRVSFNLRVCSCPARDFSKEEEVETNSSAVGDCKTSKSEGSRAKVISKKRSSSTGGDNYLLNNPELSTKRTRGNDDVMRSRKIELPIKPIIPTAEDPFVSSSQESLQSDDDGTIPQDKKTKYKDLVKCSKYLLKLSYNPDPFLNYVGCSFAREIRKTVRTVKTAQGRAQQPEKDDEAPRRPDGSPDSGVNE